MMEKLRISHVSGVAAAVVIAGAATSQADTIIESFDNYTTGGNVAAFAESTTAFTAGPNDWRIDVNGGGFGFHFDDTGNPPNGIDISGEDTLELDFSVNAGGSDGTTVIVVLEDKNGLQDVYDLGALLGNFPAGFSGTASVPLTLPATFDTTGLNFFQIQANSFAPNFPVAYSVTLEELRVVPEPASAALLGSAMMLLGLRRRPQ